LRTVEGLSITGLQEREGAEALERFLKQIAPLLGRGLLEYSLSERKHTRVRIPPDRLFVSDDIIRDCLLPV
jgi:coproporphyrinogen III oxidase-like Fe-S oxidoreductase